MNLSFDFAFLTCAGLAVGIIWLAVSGVIIIKRDEERREP